MNNCLYRILKYGFFFTLLGTIISFIVITRIVEHRTNEALQDYSMLPDNQKVVDKVVLGRSYPGFRYLSSEHMNYKINQLFRSGVIEIVCTNRNYILLVMKDFKHKNVAPGRTEKGYLFIDLRVENGEKKGNIVIDEVTFLSKGYFHTLASSPLSYIEIISIIKALEERKSNHIGFGTFDGGNAFSGNAEVSEVKKLVDRCQK